MSIMKENNLKPTLFKLYSLLSRNAINKIVDIRYPQIANMMNIKSDYLIMCRLRELEALGFIELTNKGIHRNQGKLIKILK